MAISREALEDLNQSFLDEARKIREEEEQKRKETFMRKEFVNAPTLSEDRSKAHEDLLKNKPKGLKKEYGI